MLCGPPAWVMAFDGWPGVTVTSHLEQALRGADAVMALRVQLERAAGRGVPSLRRVRRSMGPDRRPPGPALPRRMAAAPGTGQRGRRDRGRAVHRTAKPDRAPGRERGPDPDGGPVPAGDGPMSPGPRFGSLTDAPASFVLRGVRIIDPDAGINEIRDLAVVDGIVREDLAPFDVPRIDAMGLVAAPGFCDLHAHLRTPVMKRPRRSSRHPSRGTRGVHDRLRHAEHRSAARRAVARSRSCGARRPMRLPGCGSWPRPPAAARGRR